MLSILGFVFGWILRILGILLLLILLLLAAVLLVPIRYEAEASYREKTPTAQFGVYWLLHFLSVKGTFDLSQGLVYRMKILGITVKDSQREKQPKGGEKERDKDKRKDKKKDKKSKRERKKQEEKIESPETEKLPEERETAVPTEMQEPVNPPEKREMEELPYRTELSESPQPEPERVSEPELTRKNPAEEIQKQKTKEEAQKETQTEAQEEAQEQAQIEESQEGPQNQKEESQISQITEENQAEESQAAGAQIKEARIAEPQLTEPHTEEAQAAENPFKETLTGEAQGILSEENPTENQREEKEEKEDSGEAESEEMQSRPSGFERIRDIILGLIAGLSEKFQGLAQKKDALQAKIQNILDFLQAPENQETFRFLVKELKKLLSHIRPRTFRLTGWYGSADPALTGQVLGAVYMLYPIYGDSIQLTGDFEEEVLEGEMALKGRIRLGTLAVIAVRVVRNKQVRKWIGR